MVFIIKYFNPNVDGLPKKCLNLIILCGLGVKIESRVERTHPEKSLHKFKAIINRYAENLCLLVCKDFIILLN